MNLLALGIELNKTGTCQVGATIRAQKAQSFFKRLRTFL